MALDPKAAEKQASGNLKREAGISARERGETRARRNHKAPGTMRRSRAGTGDLRPAHESR